jgi:ATP-dependent helicase/nuclease subunit A
MLWSPSKDVRCEVVNGWMERERQERDREYRRLLYVAMTRAADRLYVTGFQNGKTRSEGNWYDLIQPVIAGFEATKQIQLANGETSWVYETEQTAPPKTDKAARQSLPIGTAPAWLKTPAPAEQSPTNPLQPSRPTPEEPPAQGPFGSSDESRFKRGLLVHKLLETLPALVPEARAQAAQKWLAQPAHGLNHDAQAAILEETLNVLENPDFADLFATESLAEVAISGVLGTEVVSARLDRLAVNENCVTVVDYKTNRPAPTDALNVPEQYLRQMALYRALLAKIYPKREIRCVLLWTDGPHAMALDDEILRAYEP